MPSSWKSIGFAILGSNKSSLRYCIWTFRWLRGQNTTVIRNLALNWCALLISRWQRVCTHNLDHWIHTWQTKQTTANKAAVYQINGLHCVHANTRLWWFIFTITIGCLPYHIPWMQEKNPITMKEVVLYMMTRCCCDISEHTQVLLTLNHPHCRGQQHTLLLSQHHKCYYPMTIYTSALASILSSPGY